MTIHGPTTRSPRPIPRNRPSDRRKPIPHTKGSRPDMGRLPFPYPKPTTRSRYIDTRTRADHSMGWTRIGMAGWAGPSAVPIYRTKSHVAPHENINCDIMSQLIFFVPPQVPGHDAHGIRRPSTRMLMGPCHAESGRKGPPATSHVCTGAQRHFPREPDRPAEPGRDRNRSGKTEHHNKKKEEKKEDQKQERKTQEKRTKTRRKEANTNTRNTTRARTQQQHPQTKTQDTRKNTMRVLHLAARKPP